MVRLFRAFDPTPMLDRPGGHLAVHGTLSCLFTAAILRVARRLGDTLRFRLGATVRFRIR